MISVIIVQHNNAELTVEAIRTLRQHHADGFETIVVDNGSRAEAKTFLERNAPGVQIISSPENVGFGAANNLAAGSAKGEILLFLNNDTVVTGPILGGVERAFAEDRSLGILGPKLLNPDRTFQLSAGALPTFWREIADKIVYAAVRRKMPRILSALQNRFSLRQKVGWVTGAALFIRSADFQRLGMFDETMFMYFEDKDICKRAHGAALSVIYDPALSLIHLKGGSSSSWTMHELARIYRRSQLRYYAKHRPLFEQMLLKLYLFVTFRYPRG